MQTLERKNYQKFVCRPVYCESCKSMTAHNIYFMKMSPDHRHVLYFKECCNCVLHAFEMQKAYYEQVLDTEFTEADFRTEIIIEEASPKDWKHLWIGDYYEEVDFDRIVQKK